MSEPAATSPALPPWRERSFCLLLLGLKAVHLWRSRGMLIGYDLGDHLQRYAQTGWWMPEPGLHESFYAYHPPLGFLLPHFLAKLGLETTVALQCFSTCCGAAAFLALRGALKQLGLLAQIAPVVFLYLWSAFPILVNCDVSLNLDVIILAFGLGVLDASIRWHRAARRGPRIGWSCGIVLLLAASMMTKFSGLLLFAIPGWVVLLLGNANLARRMRALAGAGVLALLAVLLVWPYYQKRYLEVEQTFFPRNQDFWVPEQIHQARALRDQDRLPYFVQFFSPRFLQPPRSIETRDTAVQRYSDAWRDLWIRDDSLYYRPAEKLPPQAPAIRLGMVYSNAFCLLSLGGAFYWLRSRPRGAFDRLGLILLAESSVFVVAHWIYCYQDAIGFYSVTKAIYVLFATTGVAFLAVGWLPWLAEKMRSRLPVRRLAGQIGWTLLCAWLLTNYLLPVY